MLVDSDNLKRKKMIHKAINNLKSVSEDIRDKVLVSYCDVSTSEICRELALKFELEDHQLPIVRIVYRMQDNSVEEKGQEQEYYKFALNTSIFEKEIEELQNSGNSDSKIFNFSDEKRIDTDSNGNIWFEDFSEEGFKTLVEHFQSNQADIDLRNQNLNREKYNESVLVLTSSNGKYL